MAHTIANVKEDRILKFIICSSPSPCAGIYRYCVYSYLCNEMLKCDAQMDEKNDGWLDKPDGWNSNKIDLDRI